MKLHEAAAKGFERGAEEYERGRPGYPDEAIDRLFVETGLGPERTAIDVGAGTGKLTRALAARGVRVFAVEPVAAMRRVLADTVRGVTVLEGTAEAIPMPDGGADVVTAAQAFHWFDAPIAFAEMARVLRPGGAVALVWNSRDPAWTWTAPIEAIMNRVAGPAPRFRSGDGQWKAALLAEPRFGELHEATFAHAAVHDLASMLARISSVSYVSALPHDRRQALLDEVAELLRQGPLHDAGPTFAEPYRTELYWCRRL